jgi:hypothetical protein
MLCFRKESIQLCKIEQAKGDTNGNIGDGEREKERSKRKETIINETSYRIEPMNEWQCRH